MRLTCHVVLAVALALAASSVVAADVSQDAIDRCIDELRATGTPDAQSGTVISTEFSEANSLVMLKDRGGSVWRCLVSNDGRSAELSVQSAADDGGGAMAGAPAPSAQGTTATERVQFASGASSADINDGLTPGSSTRFVLGAREGQFLDVSVTATGEGLVYRILNPDGSLLLDPVASTQPYRGQLWQSGDHVVEVINRGQADISYTLYVAID